MAEFITRIHYRDAKQAEYLHREADRLLGDLGHATKKGDFHKQEYLQRLYNRSMDQLLELKFGPLEDPIEALPRELWIMILKEAVSEEIDKADRMLELTLVSPRWQSALIMTPDLWTCITIPRKAGFDTLAKVATILTLSGNLLIQLDILQSPRYWDSILPLLQPCANRIVAIRLHAVRSHGTNLVVSLGDLPQLRHLEMPNPEPILDHTPSLLTIQYDNLDVIHLCHPNLKNLRKCITSQSLSSLVTRLDSLVHLTFLLLHSSPLERGMDSPLLPASLSLQHFEFYQDELRLAIKVIEISPKLTTINVGIGTKWMILFELFNISSSLDHLVMLVLRLEAPSQRVEFPSNAHNLKIKKLQLSVRGRLDDLEVTEAHDLDILSLWNYLRSRTPLIEDLHLSLIAAGPVPFNYINEMFNLRLLHLFTTSPMETPPESFKLDHLETLDMTTTLELLIPKIKPGTIKRLKYGLWGSDPISNASNMQSPAFSNVHLFKFIGGTILHGLDGLPSLTRLIFDICQGEVINDFCMKLILQPGNCPKLEQIEFLHCLPEWDLLVLMLERRNLLLDTTISPIRVLVFSRRLSPMLLSVLVQLLHRKCPARPSNRELSLGGIVENYLNASKPSCWLCCEVFMLSSGRGSEYNYFPKKIPVKMPSMPPIPPLSLELETWLQSHDDRRRQWEEQMKDDSLRMCCILHEESVRLVLTELSPYVKSNWVDYLLPDTSMKP